MEQGFQGPPQFRAELDPKEQVNQTHRSCAEGLLSATTRVGHRPEEQRPHMGPCLGRPRQLGETTSGVWRAGSQTQGWVCAGGLGTCREAGG